VCNFPMWTLTDLNIAAQNVGRWFGRRAAAIQRIVWALPLGTACVGILVWSVNTVKAWDTAREEAEAKIAHAEAASYILESTPLAARLADQLCPLAGSIGTPDFKQASEIGKADREDVEQTFNKVAAMVKKRMAEDPELGVQLSMGEKIINLETAIRMMRILSAFPNPRPEGIPEQRKLAIEVQASIAAFSDATPFVSRPCPAPKNPLTADEIKVAIDKATDEISSNRNFTFATYAIRIRKGVLDERVSIKERAKVADRMLAAVDFAFARDLKDLARDAALRLYGPPAAQ